MTTVLVTGAAGYIGSIVTRRLLRNGFHVLALDSMRFGGASLLEVAGREECTVLAIDIRQHDRVQDALTRFRPDAIVHLAAIVGDPACAKEPEIAEEINWTASVALIRSAAGLGIGRFIFISTCSNYGVGGGGDRLVDETAPLYPLSLYADLKVRVENFLLKECAWPAGSAPTVLRFATARGPSPRMRFDLTVNEFAKTLAMKRPLTIYGPRTWRPYCHVDDLAAAICLTISAPSKVTAFETFNVGDTSENYQKQSIVDEVRKVIPTSFVRYESGGEDRRDYRVDFSKIRDRLSFHIERRVSDTICAVKCMVDNRLLEDFDSKSYCNA